ncbi:MAG: winged helix DNA-binding protein [Dehalococcoidia bacterium]|nr:winged helix DNA-binding protein [Dehalococcoidia bacterium]
MPHTSPVDQDYDLWVLLNQVQSLMMNARDIELMKYGTTAMQAAVSFITNSIGEETTPAKISRWLLRKPATISGLLDRMEKAGLVERAKDLPRKNLVRIRLTEKGKQAYKQSLKRESLHKTMSCLSEKEHQQLASILVKLRNRATKVLGYREEMPFPETSRDSSSF